MIICLWPQSSLFAKLHICFRWRLQCTWPPYTPQSWPGSGNVKNAGLFCAMFPPKTSALGKEGTPKQDFERHPKGCVQSNGFVWLRHFGHQSYILPCHKMFRQLRTEPSTKTPPKRAHLNVFLRKGVQHAHNALHRNVFELQILWMSEQALKHPQGFACLQPFQLCPSQK